MARLKVVIVEDHPLTQMGIKKALERFADIRVMGQASSVRQAMEIIDSAKPDVVVMDIRLPDGDGIAATKSIRDRHADTKVLMFSGFDDERYVTEAFESGASGYLLKNVGSTELVDAVRQVANGQSPLSPQLTGKLIPLMRKKITINDRLTPREKEIWRLLSNGVSNAEISKELFISESTVKFHVRNIFHKLGVKNRVEAAKIAYQSIVA
jgi:DNA-binding NarL/FixJ family response regulator